jgi:Uma2 family endonuclease
MNITVKTPAPDLPPRRAFDVDDIRRMIEAGVLGEDENIELVEGEIVVMAPKSYAHEMIKNALVEALFKARPADIAVAVEMTIEFSRDTLFEPDIAAIHKSKIRRSKANFVSVEQGGCLLLIEVAKTSLRFDKGRKAALYAKLGVSEYWVVNTNKRVTSIHRGPSESGWASIVDYGASDRLTTPTLPDFQFKLDDIN